MLCTFCGTENRPEHKFCGMCGVRLERRKEQRRMRPSTGNVTCQSCGHVNDALTKFCGMCGLRVERRSGDRRSELTPSADARANAAANAQLPTPDTPGPRPSFSSASADLLTPPAQEEIEARRAAETIFHSRPGPGQTTIGGPSFLGLGSDNVQEGGQSQYLLDDESSSHGGRGLVFFVILILIAGLGYMGYRSGYFNNLQASAGNKKSAAASPQATPAATPLNQGAINAPSADRSDDRSGGSSPSSSSSSSSSSRETQAAAPRSKEDSAGADAPEQDDPADANDVAALGGKSPSTSKATGKEIQPPAKRKPSVALVQAQNFLQGRGGVRQDCEQGLVYLKAATEKNDPAAAVQMGALYASGHCVQQDRVMAYRWFNSAHELDPANPWIQTNLDTLWAQMSSQERSQVAR